MEIKEEQAKTIQALEEEINLMNKFALIDGKKARKISKRMSHRESAKKRF